MPSIIALIIWIALIYSLAPSIRKNSVLFYSLITLVSSGALMFSSFPVSAIINDGFAALSLWIIVMFVGIPNPFKKLSKKIRLVRTQISIAAFILTLAHFISDFIIAFELPISTGLLSLFIMLPLFITSFSFVRKRIDGKQWKKLHRWSYAAYILMLLHVILVTDNVGHMAIYSLILIMYVFFKFKGSNLVLRTAKFLLLAIVMLILGKTLFLGQESSGLQEMAKTLPNIEDSENVYTDGNYTGKADGYGPDLTVEVTVKNSLISNIEILDHNEKNSKFYMPAFETVPDEIIESQSISVAAVSGSTYTSYGIMNAVGDALSDAVESGSIGEVESLEPSGEESGSGNEKENGNSLHKRNKQ